nr:hypothetical protein [uncultured Pedobacter sp.]
MKNLELNLFELPEKEHLELSGGFDQNSVAYTQNVGNGVATLCGFCIGFIEGFL